jgi:hypothetical protein
MIALNYKSIDIDSTLAERAFYNTSFTPEKRGERMIAEYVEHFDKLVEEFSKYATPDNQTNIENDLERYRQGYVKRFTAYLNSHSNVASSFITGPANFPVEQNEKRSRWADNKMSELINYKNKVLGKLRQKYDPKLIARAPILSSDSDAISKLQDKIDKAQKSQELMKAANVIIRKKSLTDKDKIEKLIELGLSKKTIYQVLKPDYIGKTGFASYQLRNNNANIRQMKRRIEQLQKEEEIPASEKEIGGVKIVENKDITRLQLFFDAKPSVEVRSLLKSNGFRWSPKQMAWQRLLNDNARYAAEIVLQQINRTS